MNFEIISAEVTDDCLVYHFSDGTCHIRNLNVLPKKQSADIPVGWESICNGCGKCCYYRWVDLTGKVRYTGFKCKFLNEDNSCSVYAVREVIIGGCTKMAPGDLPAGMPEDCPYLEV